MHAWQLQGQECTRPENDRSNIFSRTKTFFWLKLDPPSFNISLSFSAKFDASKITKK